MTSLSVEKQIPMNSLSVEHIREIIPIDSSSDIYKLYPMSRITCKLVRSGCCAVECVVSSFHLYKEGTLIATITLNDYRVVGFNTRNKILMKIWDDIMHDIFTISPDELVKKYTSRYHILTPVPNSSWYNLLLNMTDVLGW